MAPIASCKARYGGVVDVANMYQFGAYTECFGIGPFVLEQYQLRMDSEKIDILMVDDDPGAYRLVKLILAETKQPVDFVIEPAGTMAEGLERLAEENYELVLLDLGLPDSSGVKSVEEVYRACPNPNTDAHISRETLENI